MKAQTIETISDWLSRIPEGPARVIAEPSAAAQRVTNVVIDSRKAGPGSLFVAMKGERIDSHRFIDQVFAQGAAAAVASEEYAAEHSITVPEGKVLYICEDPVRALGQLARAYRETLTIPFIEVTGSVGKTSAKDMIASALGGALRTFKTPGNLNNQFGVPLAVLSIEEEHEAAVIETGMNHFGEIRYLASIVKPDIGVITNIGVSHIEYLGSQRGILQAKTEMLEYMDEDDALFVCGDDPLLREYAAASKVPATLYGFSEDCGLRAVETRQRGEYLDVQAVCGGDRVCLSAPTRGRHMAFSMLAAYGIGRRLGLDGQALVRGIESFIPTDKRMTVTEGKYTILDDSYNAAPSSMKAAIDVLMDYPKERGRRVAVLGDMFELGPYTETGHREVGEYAAERKVDLLIGAGEAAAFIVESARRTDPALQTSALSGTEELSEHIKELLRPDDIVLIKASHGMGFSAVAALLNEEVR